MAESIAYVLLEFAGRTYRVDLGAYPSLEFLANALAEHDGDNQKEYREGFVQTALTIFAVHED